MTVLCFFLLTAPTGAQERPEALEGVSIQDNFIPSEFREVGRIERIVGEGRIVVLHRSDRQAYFASPGDPVHENDAVYSLGRIRCRILFEDRNVVTMAPESDLIIDEVNLDSLKGEKRSRFEVTRGRVLFYAIQLFRYRKVRLNVKTPTASVGIRGTKFGTEIEKVPSHGGAPGAPRIASREPVLLADDSAAAGVLTRIYVAMGRVNVASEVDETSRDLAENEFMEADALGLGPARYDPGRVRSFVNSVEGPMGAGEDPEPAPNGTGPLEDDAKQQEDMIRQLEQLEDAKGGEVQREFELEHTQPPSEPSEHTPPPPHGESYP